MKKKSIIISFMLSIFIIAVAFFNIKVSPSEPLLANLTLNNIEALANGEQNVKDCPGGSCTFTDSFGQKCTACCNEKDKPKCNVFGCECDERIF